MSVPPPNAGDNIQVPSTGGLVSLVGLDTFMEENGSRPLLDCEEASGQPPQNESALQRRRDQLATMGHFITHPYLQHHVAAIRRHDTNRFAERAQAYQMALERPPQEIPSYEDKSPKPFRPSSSRLEPVLSRIPFNVHVHSLSVEHAETTSQGSVFHNVTCAAPADHARGFSNIISSTNGTDGANVSPVGQWELFPAAFVGWMPNVWNWPRLSRTPSLF